jgi:hypothetical protein
MKVMEGATWWQPEAGMSAADKGWHHARMAGEHNLCCDLQMRAQSALHYPFASLHQQKT